MTDDLVTEARKGGPCAELGDRCRAIEAASGCFCAAVADRIEQLQAQNLRLSGMCHDLKKEVAISDALLISEGEASLERLARAEKAEADNARLLDHAVDLFRQVRIATYSGMAVRREIPAVQIQILADIDAAEFRAALTGKEPSHE